MRTKAKTSVFDVINYILLALFALITLYPFWYTLVGSFSHGTDYMAGGVWLFPRKFALDNYLVVLTDMRLYRSLLITVSRLVLVTFLQLLFLSMVAYAFSHPALKGKKIFMWLNLFTMFFSGGWYAFMDLFVVLKKMLDLPLENRLKDNFLNDYISFWYDCKNPKFEGSELGFCDRNVLTPRKA